LLGIAPEDITLFNETDHLFIQELIVPAISAHRHVRTGDICVDRDVFLEMRGRLVAASMSDLKALPPRENHSIEILYVSRAMERWRRVVNEEDVIRAISKFGSVEILDPKLLSASAQIDVFRRSRLVVSPLGGASPTTMFCKAGTDIVELSSPLLKGDWGHRVWAGLFDLGHLRLEGVIDGCRNDGALPIDQDFSLPIDRLSVAMTKLFGD
jgi:capsular polysaccharide biosynthesis protein